MVKFSQAAVFDGISNWTTTEPAIQQQLFLNKKTTQSLPISFVEMSKPEYKDPLYWLSILAPPIIFSFGFLIATFYGVSMGISDGVDNSMRRIEASNFAEVVSKQALEGANKFVRETDILKEVTKQVSGQFKGVFSNTKPPGAI